MKYIHIDLYDGRSQILSEVEFLDRKRGLGRGVRGDAPGVMVWQGEEELLIRIAETVDTASV